MDHSRSTLCSKLQKLSCLRTAQCTISAHWTGSTTTYVIKRQNSHSHGCPHVRVPHERQDLNINMHWDPRSQLNTPGLHQRRLERADVCRPALGERFGLSKHDTSMTLTSRITQSQPTDVFCRSLQERRHSVSLCSRFGSLQTIARPVAAARTFEQPPCRLQKNHEARQTQF